jgi:hypothetical protein
VAMHAAESTIIDSRSVAHDFLFTGLLSFGVYWIAMLSAVLLLVLHEPLSLLAVICLIIVYHGTHEAVHDGLVPRLAGLKRSRDVITFVSAAAGFALVGHNFLLLRWSHGLHHSMGRLDPSGTIDGKAAGATGFARLRYYLNLCGFSYYAHELIGYLYLIAPSGYHILDRRFRPWSYPFGLYPFVQLLVAATTVSLLYFGGGYYIACRLLFGLYWGLMQNVAHYGLEHGSVFAARTYRTHPLLEFLLFKAGMRHIEHHVFPLVPGYCLDDPRVQSGLARILGFAPKPKMGTLAYYKDVLRQIRGPEGSDLPPTEWRSGGPSQ